MCQDGKAKEPRFFDHSSFLMGEVLWWWLFRYSTFPEYSPARTQEPLTMLPWNTFTKLCYLELLSSSGIVSDYVTHNISLSYPQVLSNNHVWHMCGHVITMLCQSGHKLETPTLQGREEPSTAGLTTSYLLNLLLIESKVPRRNEHFSKIWNYFSTMMFTKTSFSEMQIS